jgi:DNA-binding IclR family transcriptional regulator
MERTAERNIPDVVVARVSAVLGAFDERHPGLRVSEISRRTGLPMSTTSRLVAELVDHGFLDRDGPSLRIGVRLSGFGELAARQRGLRAVALPFMADLRAATGQSVHLAVLAGAEAVYVETLPSRIGPRMPSEVGGRLPAHACAVGKALLAYGDAATVDLVCGGSMAAIGPRTVTAPAVLRRHLDQIRERRLAYQSEESGPGIDCVAGAILVTGGRAAAAISVSGRTGGLDLRSIGLAVRTVVLAIGRALPGPEVRPRRHT